MVNQFAGSVGTVFVDTAHRSFKLRLPDRRTAPVSTAIVRKNKTKAAYTFPQNQWLQ